MNPETPSNQNHTQVPSNISPQTDGINPVGVPTQPDLSQIAPVPSKKKMYVIIATVLLLLIIIVASLVVVHDNHKAVASQIDIEQHNYEATVVITANAYTPATLTIRPDTEVFFENHSLNQEGENGLTHTVMQSKASHNQTEGFDSGQILAKSGYGYVFRNTGTYQFYDADNPSLTETIVVKN